MANSELPTKVNVTLFSAVVNKFQTYFEPYFKEVADNSNCKTPFPPERLVTSEGN